MRKILVRLVVCLSVLFLTTACGEKKPTEEEIKAQKTQEAFDKSKAAYDNINEAYEQVEEFGSDLYEAWRLGIYEDDNLSLSDLSKELKLSKEDLEAGVGYMFSGEDLDVWEKMTEEEKKDAIKEWSGKWDGLVNYVDSKFSICVELVSDAYAATGKQTEIQEKLDAAKGQMKELSAEFSDYEHYPALKGYYTTTNAFFEFCKSPTGSFEQVKDTINNYRNDARSYDKDLDYIFED